MAKPGGGRSGRVALGLQEKSEKCVAMSMVRVKHCGPWTPEVQQPFEVKDENTSTFKLVLSKSKSSSFSSFSSHSALQITRLRVNQMENKERLPGLSRLVFNHIATCAENGRWSVQRVLQWAFKGLVAMPHFTCSGNLYLTVLVLS